MKNKLNAIEALIFKSLIDSYISHDEFVSVSSALKEYNEIKRRNIKFCGIYIKTIEKYCTSCKKYTANDNLSVTKLNKLDKCFCAVCGKKKSTFIKNKEPHNFNNIWNDQFKMNRFTDKFLLTWDKYMQELYLK